MSVVNDGADGGVSQPGQSELSAGRSAGRLAASERSNHRPGDHRGHSMASRQVRNRALLLTLLALGFYLGFIALTLYRSHHG